MDQFTLNLLVVGATFALYIGIAIWARAGSTSEFYAAGRGVHPITNGMATGADWMSAASFISMAGLLAFGGYATSSYLMGWTGGYVLLALLLAPYLRKFGKFTVPEFIGDRFYSPTARMVAVICLIVASVTYVIGQMTGVGVAFSRFLEVNNTTGLLIGAAVVFFYAVLGGMKGVTYTQVAQYCVLITAYTIPAVFIALQLTGTPIPAIGLFSDVQGTSTPLLERLNGTIQDLGFASYTVQNGSPSAVINMVLFTFSLMIGTAGLPHVIIRFFTVPKVSDARWSAGWTLVFIALLYLTAPAVGSMARLNIFDTMWPQGPEGEAIQVENLPDWMHNWEKTGLLGWEDKNGDGRIQYYQDGTAPGGEGPNFDSVQQRAEESGWLGNELTNFNRDILVLANPEIAQLPGWVIALVAAGGLAAALSTAAGLLLAISGSISHDLIKGQINPNISEKGELLAARVAMAGAIVVATYLGLNPPGFAAQTVALAFGLAAASLFPALMMGIFVKRVNNVGAVAGMLAGLIFTLVY
ncbi:MAG: sodium:solute symporter family protein, partial [Pseudomonadota bacterium]